MIWAFNTSVFVYKRQTLYNCIIKFLGRNIKTSAVRNISSKHSHNTFSRKMKMTFCNKDY